MDKNNCCIDLQSTIPSAGKSYILLTKKYKCKIEVQISSTKYKYKIEVQITCTKYKEQKRKLQNTQRTAALTYIVQKLLRTKRLQSLPLRVDFGGIAWQSYKTQKEKVWTTLSWNIVWEKDKFTSKYIQEDRNI